MSEITGGGDAEYFDGDDNSQLPLDAVFRAAIEGFYSTDLHPGYTKRPIHDLDTSSDYEPPHITGHYDVNQFGSTKTTPQEDRRNSMFLAMLTTGLYERYEDYTIIQEARPGPKDMPMALAQPTPLTLLELQNDPAASDNDYFLQVAVVDRNRLIVTINGDPPSYAVYKSYGTSGVYKNRRNPRDLITPLTGHDGPNAMVREIQTDQLMAAQQRIAELYKWENWEKVGQKELAYVAGLIGLVEPSKETAASLEDHYHARAATQIEASIPDAQVAGEMFTHMHRRFLERRGVDVASAYPIPYTCVIPDTPHSTFQITAGFGAFSDPLVSENTSLVYDNPDERLQPYFQMYHEIRGEGLPDFREMMLDRLEEHRDTGYEVASGLPSHSRVVMSCYVDPITKAYAWRTHEVIYGEFNEPLCDVHLLMLGDRRDVGRVRDFMFDPHSGFSPDEYGGEPGAEA